MSNSIKAYYDTNLFRNFVEGNAGSIELKIDDIAGLFSLTGNGTLKSYYSAAHIDDIQGWNDVKKRDTCRIITALTYDIYLYYDYIDNEFKVEFLSPLSEIERVNESNAVGLVFDDIFNDLGELGDNLRKTLKSIELSKEMLAFSRVFLSDGEEELIQQNIPRNVYDFAKQSYEVNQGRMIDLIKYKAMRHMLRDLDSTSKKHLSRLRNDIDRGNYNKFIEYWNILADAAKPILKSALDHFTLMFNFLDYIGLGSEKTPMMNLISDAHHTAYAVVCDSHYFVTDDKRLTKKADVAYKIFGKNCEIMNTIQFIQTMKEKFPSQWPEPGSKS